MLFFDAHPLPLLLRRRRCGVCVLLDTFTNHLTTSTFVSYGVRLPCARPTSSFWIWPEASEMIASSSVVPYLPL